MKAIELGHIITDYINSKGDTISPKKLQKLIYYVDAWHLVHFGSQLVDEDFEAWVHGPVVPELYHELKKFGFNDIKVVNDELDTANKRIRKTAKKSNLSEDQLELIFSVLNKYGSLTSYELEMLSHSEKPWLEARQGVPPHVRCTNKISRQTMKDFYSLQIS
ncbi:MAG: type II toxin-antitoxin system antitoxin SocA domain-containing protein [Bacteroidota bacterium]